MRSFNFTMLALCLALTQGFAPLPKAQSSKTSLNMFENEKQTVATVMAAAFLAVNVATVAPAMASTMDFGGSSQVVAGRSGGRAGGRAGGGGARRSAAPSARSYSAPRSTYRSSTTIVRPMYSPPVVISPFGGGYGYGYNPLGGMGLGYGLGAMQGNRDEARDYRQESEIQQSKAELDQAKLQAAELEARIKALEAASAKQ
jgi:hypothetical protein